ncbi:hypothetical protein [Arthrobacter sp. RCC_34]|uniref:hypothetical protein n=1 Tax=Arthrobacter sp. RCC_34 TaxID=3239230 RepID=UPI0035268914
MVLLVSLSRIGASLSALAVGRYLVVGLVARSLSGPGTHTSIEQRAVQLREKEITMSENPQEKHRTVARRTVTRAAAWSIPVIAAAVATPAQAASGPTPVRLVDVAALPVTVVSASDAPVVMTINGTPQPTYRPTLDNGGTGTTITYRATFTITNNPSSTEPFPVDGAMFSFGYHDSAQLGLSTGPNKLFSFMDAPNRDINLTKVTPGFTYGYLNTYRYGPDMFDYSVYEGGYVTSNRYSFNLPATIPPGGSLTFSFDYTVHALPIHDIQAASDVAAPVTVTNTGRSGAGVSASGTAAGWIDTDSSNNRGLEAPGGYQNFTYLS